MKSVAPLPAKSVSGMGEKTWWFPNALHDWILLGLILPLSIGLRLYQLGTESLWVDEHFSILDAINLNLGTRPLYYLLLHGWMQFGTSDAWLRALSLPFSIISVLLVYLVAERLVSKPTARVAALMSAISPLFVGYGQEIRMYALSTFLTLVGTLLLIHALKQPGKRIIALWAIVRLLAILTTPLNMILLGPDLLLCAWQFRRKTRWLVTIGVAVAFIGVATAPIALLMQTKAPEFLNDWVATKPKPTPLKIGGMLTEFTIFWPLTDLPDQKEMKVGFDAFGWTQFYLLFYIFASGVILCVFLVGLLQSVVQARARQEPGLLWIATWGTLPPLALLTLSYISSTVWFARYLQFAAPYVLIIVAAGIVFLWQRYRHIAIFAIAIYAVSVSGGLWHYYTTFYHDNWRGAAQIIEAQEQPGDIIGLFPSQWRDPAYTLPRYYNGSLPIATWDDFKPVGERELVEPFVDDMIDSLPKTEGRTWIVVYYSWEYVQDAIYEEIYARYDVMSVDVLPNSVNAPIHVFLVEPKESTQ